MNSALVDLAETMTEEERRFTVQILEATQDARAVKVSARRVALILKTLGEDLEQVLNRRTP